MSTPNIYFDFENRKALFESKVTKTKTQLMAADLDTVLQGFSSAAFFDTGLLPVGNHSGLLALRGGFGHLQIVYQIEPGIQHVIWGKSERDTTAGHYQLAQPYRIWVADFYNGNISGARHFYSPTPITSPEDKLYHVNLPNTNCKGYNNTGVGWMCLYHTDDTTKYSVKQLIEYAFMRAGGGEAYNDNNMSGTDGPRFYSAQKRPSYFWNPNQWQAKSFSDGFDWTCDEKLLIPVLVEGPDSQSAHGGKHNLRVDDVMNGTYNSYYTDKWPLKPVSALKRGMFTEKFPDLLPEFLARAVQTNAAMLNGSMFSGYDVDPRPIIAALRDTKVVEVPPVPKVECDHCHTMVGEDTVQWIIKDFPSDVEELIEAQSETYPVCANCSHAITDVRIDFLYTAGPDHGGFNVGGVKTYLSDTATIAGVGAYPITNADLLTHCTNCNRAYPRYITQWGIDIDVYDYNNQVGIEAVSGCIDCLNHVYCAISNRNIDADRAVSVNLINHFVNPPVPYQAMVADWLVMADQSPYKVCACGIVSSCTQHVGTHENAPVCGGCSVDGEFVSAFPQLNQAVNVQFNPHIAQEVQDEYEEIEEEDEGYYYEDEFEDEPAF